MRAFTASNTGEAQLWLLTAGSSRHALCVMHEARRLLAAASSSAGAGKGTRLFEAGLPNPAALLLLRLCWFWFCKFLLPMSAICCHRSQPAAAAGRTCRRWRHQRGSHKVGLRWGWEKGVCGALKTQFNLLYWNSCKLSRSSQQRAAAAYAAHLADAGA